VSPPPQLPGSPIWRLLKNAFHIIQSKLSWDLGNGAHINVWSDRILSLEPMEHQAPLHPLKYWCYSKGLFLLKYVCIWAPNGDWINSKPMDTPSHLRPLSSLLFNRLDSCAPPNFSKSDFCSWGSSNYSVKEGYSLLQYSFQGPSVSKIWKEIWSKPSLPKVNILCWLMVHVKILTVENFQKHRIMGPYRCPLCLEASKTIPHLFLEFPFSSQF
jgi:hypothetical protein